LPRDPPYAKGSLAARANAASARVWLAGLDPIRVDRDAFRAEMIRWILRLKEYQHHE